MAVHDKFLRDINRIRALNESFLREDVESRCESISIEDDLFHSEGVSTAQSIASLLSEWQQLDADYLVDFSRVNGTGKRTGLAVPYSFDISQMDVNSSNFAGMNHERIPPELTTEYLTKLTKLLKKVPQDHKSGGTCMLLNSADNTEKFLVHDLHLMPELRPPFERYTTTVKVDNTEEILPVSPLSRHTTRPLRDTDKEYKEVVISVTVYRADSRLTQPQQCIDVLSSQTLSQLQQAIYCVHNHTHQSGDGANCNSSSSSNERSHDTDKDAFFCIDGQIYAQLCRPFSSSLRTHPTSCACHNIETSSATSNSSSASQQRPTNDYIPGAEPVRALMWLYRSLFGIVLPNLATDTTTSTNISNTTAHSSSNNHSASGITNAENDNAPDADHNNHNNHSNSCGSSSSSAEDTEQIIFVNTTEPTPPATIASTITKPKRSRPPKNTKNSSATDVQPSADQPGPVATGSSSLKSNAVNTSVVGTGDTLAQAQQPGRGKKRSSTDNTAPSASASTSTAQKGRKKPSTITSSIHNNTNSIVDTTTKGDNDTFVRLHPYDFNALRTAIASSNTTIEMKCVYNVRLADINFTLGVPYLYAHACGCEHILYITNVRSYSHKYDCMAPATDTINLQYSTSVAMTITPTTSIGYPVETFRARHKQKRCAVCEVLPAVCVVFEDRLAETNPTLYCEHCYHMLHYAADGQRLYDDFQMFPYTHDP